MERLGVPGLNIVNIGFLLSSFKKFQFSECKMKKEWFIVYMIIKVQFWGCSPWSELQIEGFIRRPPSTLSIIEVFSSCSQWLWKIGFVLCCLYRCYVLCSPCCKCPSAQLASCLHRYWLIQWKTFQPADLMNWQETGEAIDCCTKSIMVLVVEICRQVQSRGWLIYQFGAELKQQNQAAIKSFNPFQAGLLRDCCYFLTEEKHFLYT